MKNPGIDLEIWKRLRKKWADLNVNGHKVSVRFDLITHPDDNKNILAIDVIQTIDNELVIETIQRDTGEAYAVLGINGLSRERLEKVYEDIVLSLFLQTTQRDTTMTVNMSPTSPTSGELRGFLEKHNSDSKESVQLNYQHYYILNALREKMIEQLGENWDEVKVVCRADHVEFYFDYSS